MTEAHKAIDNAAMPIISNIRLQVATFNMGNAKDEGLEHLIPAEGGDVDLFAIGLQESTYSDGVSITEMEEKCVLHLTATIDKLLGEHFYMVIKYY
jgi:hypothetical protein